MRLTVHVKDAKEATSEKKTKDGFVKKTHTFNTLSFSGIHPEDVASMLTYVKDSGMGTPTKHYLSEEKIAGKARLKKK